MGGWGGRSVQVGALCSAGFWSPVARGPCLRRRWSACFWKLLASLLLWPWGPVWGEMRWGEDRGDWGRRARVMDAFRAGFRPSPTAGTWGGLMGSGPRSRPHRPTLGRRRKGCPEREAQGSATPRLPDKTPRTPSAPMRRKWRLVPSQKDGSEERPAPTLPEWFCSARKKRWLRRSDRPFPEKLP